LEVVGRAEQGKEGVAGVSGGMFRLDPRTLNRIYEAPDVGVVGNVGHEEVVQIGAESLGLPDFLVC
jgi:hypothetical protein